VNVAHFARQPLYSQVHGALVDRIATRVWKPGTLLPNEQELAREFGVSAGTMQKALAQLERDRFIARKQGRGTFVIDQTSPERILRFVNLRDANGERVAGVGRILAQAVRPAAALKETRLQVETTEPIVWTNRLRTHRGLPLLVEERYLALSRFPGLKAGDVGDYEIIVLAQSHGVHLAKAIEDVRISRATPQQASLLEVDAGHPLLALDRVIYSGEDLPVEQRIAFCRLTDQFYSAELH
jgi:GntR family transcriptional regulator